MRLIVMLMLSGVLSTTTKASTHRFFTANAAGETLEIIKFNGNTHVAKKAPTWSSFSELLETSPLTKEDFDISNSEAQLPIKGKKLKYMGIGLSYPDHQQEVDQYQVVSFEKNAEPTPINQNIAHRPFLDYEAEIALLMHRHENNLFAYLLHNDLTDRQIQVFEFDPKNPAPGFSKSKSFEGANTFSPIMIVGDQSIWSDLQVELFVNNELRQTVQTHKNILEPKEIHTLIFSNSNIDPSINWVLVGTGTAGGTIFRTPSLFEKITTFVKSGFSVQKAKTRWLNTFKFLEKGDKLEFRSKILGKFKTYVE